MNIEYKQFTYFMKNIFDGSRMDPGGRIDVTYFTIIMIRNTIEASWRICVLGQEIVCCLLDATLKCPLQR